LERLTDHLRSAGAGNVSQEIAVDHPVRAILAVAERWKATLRGRWPDWPRMAPGIGPGLDRS